MNATDDQLGGVKFGHEDDGSTPTVGNNLDIGFAITSGRHVFYFTANETNLNIARHTNSATGAYKFSIGYISAKESRERNPLTSLSSGAQTSLPQGSTLQGCLKKAEQTESSTTTLHKCRLAKEQRECYGSN